ncbi:MAG: glycosyltransferase family 2 protein [Chloroflexi bacterium]|nr:glycosyltransferase family 2 protein [Chloroflexota bacterium]
MSNSGPTSVQGALRPGATVSVVIPAHNEAPTIGILISQIKEILSELRYEIILVDDGSGDDTTKIAQSHGAIVVSHKVNRGKGAAMKTGAETATGEVVVFMDGDGQHRPGDLAKVLAPVLAGTADLVIGSRTLPESEVTVVPVRRKWSNWAASFVISFMVSVLLPVRTGFKVPLRWTTITDCTSGFRAVRKDKWQQLSLVSNGFEIETEIILEAARNRLVIKESPISCSWKGRLSHLNILRDGIRTMKLLLGKLARS